MVYSLYEVLVFGDWGVLFVGWWGWLELFAWDDVVVGGGVWCFCFCVLVGWCCMRD